MIITILILILSIIILFLYCSLRLSSESDEKAGYYLHNNDKQENINITK